MSPRCINPFTNPFIHSSIFPPLFTSFQLNLPADQSLNKATPPPQPHHPHHSAQPLASWKCALNWRQVFVFPLSVNTVWWVKLAFPAPPSVESRHCARADYLKEPGQAWAAFINGIQRAASCLWLAWIKAVDAPPSFVACSSAAF